MSLVASYVAAGVILIRFFIRKAPAIFSYMLWAILLFRLVCPISFESSVTLIPSTFDTMPADIANLQTADITLGTIKNSAMNLNLNQTISPEGSGGNGTFELMAIFSILWIIGILAILTYAIVSYIRFKKKISTATLIKDNIYETDLIKTPFVCGFIKPKIYVLTGMQQNELNYILLHEQIHIGRLDYLIKPFAFLVTAVYWFNPVIWISYFLMSRDMEMSCDEKVMKDTKAESKGLYANLLLSLSSKQSGLLNPLSFGRIGVKARIRNVLRYKKPNVWITGSIFLLVALAAVLLISNPVADKSRMVAENFLKAYYSMDDELMIGKNTEYILIKDANTVLALKYGDYLTDEASDAIGSSMQEITLKSIKLTKGPVSINGDFPYYYEVKVSVQIGENTTMENITKGELLMTEENGEWEIDSIYFKSGWDPFIS